jgi:hypothetical protein
MTSQRMLFQLCRLAVLCLVGQWQVYAQSSEHACETWKSSIADLSERDRTLLARYGAIYRKEWHFSDQIVSDCALRVKMAWYFRRVIQGRIDAAVTRFGWMHSKAIDSVLERVWPLIAYSEALPSDGSFESEAWALLRQPWVSSETYGRVMQREIGERGLSRAAVFSLLERPTQTVRPDLLKLVNRSESGGRALPLAELVAALILLDILEDSAAIDKLKMILEGTIPSEAERAVIRTIVESIGRNEAIRWSDIEPLHSEW